MRRRFVLSCTEDMIILHTSMTDMERPTYPQRPDADDFREGRWKAIREFGSFVAAGGPGRSVPEAEDAAITEELKTFTPEERTGYMRMRDTDLNRIVGDLREMSRLTEGRTEAYPNAEGDTVRIEWGPEGVRLISEWNDGDGGTKETTDPDEIAERHDMLSLISVYRAAERALEGELMRDDPTG